MKLSLTTPRGALVDLDVEEVTAPGALGEFGVLPGHEPLMSALRPGVLVYRAKDHSGVVAVGPGFLQVAAPTQAGGADTARDRVLVLVDQAMPAGDIDRAEAERDLVAADKELAAWQGELDGAFKALDLRRQWAQARVDACGRGPGAAH
ncbi:MAG TPA: ATP synthase F1 subunit epsilon [Polyangia bacterium]|nr:ATP synthase F1 subunit epsilon [Polyangia bacterium]